MIFFLPIAAVGLLLFLIFLGFKAAFEAAYEGETLGQSVLYFFGGLLLYFTAIPGGVFLIAYAVTDGP